MMLLCVLGLSALFPGIIAHPLRDLPTNDSDSGISVDWSSTLIMSKTTATLQVVGNAPLLPNSSIHDQAFQSLKLVSHDYVRMALWFPYPKLAVAELEPPVMQGNECTTSWEFEYLDMLTKDFFANTPGVSHIVGYSTTPTWMWVLPPDEPYDYPEDVNSIDFEYNNGTQLRDPTFKEVSDYFARIAAWYTAGGFTDECGMYHRSGNYYTFEYWEILNEPNFEHYITAPYYNKIYDAVVTAVRAVIPSTRFVGPALPSPNIDYLETFLNPANHAPNISLDVLSYHFYANPTNGTQEDMAAQSFEQASNFISEVAQVDLIRRSLSPNTKTTLDEVGTLDPQGEATIIPGHIEPDVYWVWSGAVYAYLYSELSRLGIDSVGESQLYGYPGQFPSVSMVEPDTGLPNARLRVLQLLQHSFAPGYSLLQTESSLKNDTFYAQAFVSPEGEKKLLLVNKKKADIRLQVSDFQGGKAAIVDLNSGGEMWRIESVDDMKFRLTGYATAVLTEK